MQNKFCEFVSKTSCLTRCSFLVRFCKKHQLSSAQMKRRLKKSVKLVIQNIMSNTSPLSSWDFAKTINWQSKYLHICFFPPFCTQFWMKHFAQPLIYTTLFESENERQKIEPVPILLPRASRNFPDVKTRNEFFFIIELWR